MISREEKNKIYVDEIKKEKSKKILKVLLKITGIILVIFTLIFLYSYYLEPTLFKTREYIVKDSIPNSFDGTKILHFSDILYGKTIKEKELEKISKEIELINPDIVIFTGNIISKDYSINEDEIKKLNYFFANIPYSIGKYAVNGDTDNNNFDLILDNTDFTILNDSKLEIFGNSNEKINLIGIGNEKDDSIKKDDVYTITIINNYDNYNKEINSDLVFAGHNLGGEIRLFNIPLLGMDKHLNSYYNDGNTKVYISNGLGSINHLRLMNRPSMNVYRLYAKDINN